MFIVCGDGIYQFSLLPKDLQVKHKTRSEAEQFISTVADRLDQSFLCFDVREV